MEYWLGWDKGDPAGEVDYFVSSARLGIGGSEVFGALPAWYLYSLGQLHRWVP